jgi:hypothetical protein
MLLAGVSALVTSVTLGLFHSTTATQTATFAAGTVSLTSDTAGTCDATNLLPGAPSRVCTLVAAYDGTLNGRLGLDVLIETQPGAGGMPLFNPGVAGGLQVAIADNQNPAVAYTVPTVATACPAGAPAGSTCYRLDNQLVRLGDVAAGTAVTFTTTVSIPAASPTGYQGGTAQIVLTAHAIQAANTSTAGCTAGQPCATVTWSP